jgi:transcriptional antiterminator RfaH
MKTNDPHCAWFCIRTQLKREHIAAAALRTDLGLQTYLPRISFKRSTPRGPVWFTDALFPSYLFGRFHLESSAVAVQYSRGVRGIVHFGDQWPAVPDSVISELQLALGHCETHVIENDFAPGESVEIVGGAFHGLSAVVTRVMPSQDRIAVLLDFLGRQTAVELSANAVVRPAIDRGCIWRGRGLQCAP